MTALSASAIISAALFDSLNPCAVGVMLLFVALLFALYKERRLVWLFGLSYVVGVFVTYLFIGLGLLRAVHLFGIHGFFGYVAGALLILFGFIHLDTPLLRRWSFAAWLNSCHIPTGWRKKVERGTVIAALTLGLLVGICEFPCSGGIYLGAVGLLANSTTFLAGVSWLLLYNFIFVLPLLLILIIAGQPVVLNRLAAWQQRHAKTAKSTMGWVMILAGLFLLLWLTI